MKPEDTLKENFHSTSSLSDSDILKPKWVAIDEQSLIKIPLPSNHSVLEAGCSVTTSQGVQQLSGLILADASISKKSFGALAALQKKIKTLQLRCNSGEVTLGSQDFVKVLKIRHQVIQALQTTLPIVDKLELIYQLYQLFCKLHRNCPNNTLVKYLTFFEVIHWTYLAIAAEVKHLADDDQDKLRHQPMVVETLTRAHGLFEPYACASVLIVLSLINNDKTLVDWGLTENTRKQFKIEGFLDYGLSVKRLIQHFLCINSSQTQRGKPVFIHENSKIPGLLDLVNGINYMHQQGVVAQEQKQLFYNKLYKILNRDSIKLPDYLSIVTLPKILEEVSMQQDVVFSGRKGGAAPKQSSLAKDFQWRIPQLSYFVVREEICKAMVSALNKPIDKNTKRVVCVLHGADGMGKTKLALHYINTQLNSEKFPFHCWFNARKLNQEFRDFAHEKNLLDNVATANIKTIQSKVLDWFNSKEDCLIVYDNVLSKSQIEAYLPKGHILITSVNSNSPWHLLGECSLVPVGKMNSAEAKALLDELIGQNYPENAALAKKLGWFPLALAQAGSFIHGNITTQEYLELYETEQAELLNNNSLESNEIGEPRASVATTWNINIKKITSKDASDGRDAETLLNCCAYLATAPVTEKLLLKILNKIRLIKAKKLLKEYSLIDYEMSGRSLTMHPLLQAVIRLQLERAKDQSMTLHYLIQISTAFCQIYQKGFGNLMKNIQLLPHAVALMNHLLEHDNEIDVRYLAHMLQVTGYVRTQIGEPKQAVESLQTAYRYYLKLLNLKVESIPKFDWQLCGLSTNDLKKVTDTFASTKLDVGLWEKLSSTLYSLGRMYFYNKGAELLKFQALQYVKLSYAISYMLSEQTKLIQFQLVLIERSGLLHFNLESNKLEDLIHAEKRYIAMLNDQNRYDNHDIPLNQDKIHLMTCWHQLAKVRQKLASIVDEVAKKEKFLIAAEEASSTCIEVAKARAQTEKVERLAAYYNTLGGILLDVYQLHQSDEKLDHAEVNFRLAINAETRDGVEKQDYPLADGYYGLAQIHYTRKDFQKAKSCIEKCISIRAKMYYSSDPRLSKARKLLLAIKENYQPLQQTTPSIVAPTLQPSSTIDAEHAEELEPSIALTFPNPPLDEDMGVMTLVEAAQQNNLQQAKELYKYIIDINDTGERKRTALHWACHHCNDKIVKLLLKNRQIKINLQDENFNTPLHLVLKCEIKNSEEAEKQIEVINLLFSHRPDRLDTKLENSYSETAIELAYSLSHKSLRLRISVLTPFVKALHNDQLLRLWQRILHFRNISFVDLQNRIDIYHSRHKKPDTQENIKANNKLAWQFVRELFMLDEEEIKQYHPFHYLAHLRDKGGVVLDNASLKSQYNKKIKQFRFKPVHDCKLPGDTLPFKIFEGWNSVDFLTARLHVYVQVLLELKKGALANLTQKFTDEEKRVLILFLTREIYYGILAARAAIINYAFCNEESLLYFNFTDEYAYFEEKFKLLHIRDICRHIGKLQDQELFYYATGHKTHTVYVVFTRDGDNIRIRIDNAGEGYFENGHRREIIPQEGAQEKIRVFPKSLAQLPVSAFATIDDRSCNYIKALFEATKLNGQEGLSNVYRKPQQSETYSPTFWRPPKKAFEKGHCVLRNHNIGLMHRFLYTCQQDQVEKKRTQRAGKDYKPSRTLYRWVKQREEQMVLRLKI